MDPWSLKRIWLEIKLNLISDLNCPSKSRLDVAHGVPVAELDVTIDQLTAISLPELVS